MYIISNQILREFFKQKIVSGMLLKELESTYGNKNKITQETQLLLTKRATHCAIWNGVADLIRWFYVEGFKHK